MDEATATQWQAVAADSDANDPPPAELCLARLRQLAANDNGFAVDELTHSLQCAALAEADGAGDEVLLAALFHDVGHLFGDVGHGAIAAEVIAPFVPADLAAVVRYHTDFTSRHYARFFDDDPDRRLRHRGQPWFDLAEQFADEWDQRAFDPTYPTPPVEHFAPLVRQLVVER
jgi:predicted HD phosphohydrolase